MRLPALLPRELGRIAPGVTLENDLRRAVQDADVIMMLRVQLEWIHEPSMPAGEYFRFYGLRHENMQLARPDAIVMHPGPMNRGREISSEVADSQQSMILNQGGERRVGADGGTGRCCCSEAADQERASDLSGNGP